MARVPACCDSLVGWGGRRTRRDTILVPGRSADIVEGVSAVVFVARYARLVVKSRSSDPAGQFAGSL